MNTIRHSAWLAWRFPPRLRRWRVTLPEDAGEGRDTAEVRPRGFGADPFGVVAGGDRAGWRRCRPRRRRRRAVRGRWRARAGRGARRASVVVRIESHDAPAEALHRELRRIARRRPAGAWSQRGGSGRRARCGAHHGTRSRSSSGPQNPRWRSWLRHLIRVSRAGTLGDEQGPHRLHGTVRRSWRPRSPGPLNAARAASTASAGSDLPLAGAAWRFGRSTSITSTRSGAGAGPDQRRRCRCLRHRPGRWSPNADNQSSSSVSPAECRRERLDTETPPIASRPPPHGYPGACRLRP